MAESGANISRLTSALQRNEELTKELEAIVQNTTKSLLDYSGQEGGAAAEPEFHARLDMGKVRLTVSVPGGATLVVPCDHRQKIADLVAMVKERSGRAEVASLTANGATLSPSDTIGDVLVDGDRVAAGGPPGSGTDSPRAGGGDASEDAGEVDMQKLLGEISSKLARADEALRAKAEAERKAKIQAEALLSVYRAVTKDKEQAVRAIICAIRKLLGAELASIYFIQDELQEAAEHEHKPRMLALPVDGADVEGSDFFEPAPEVFTAQTQTAGRLEVPIGDTSFVGMVARDEVAAVQERRCIATPTEVLLGSEAMRRDPAGTWASSVALRPDGKDVPAGFEASNTLITAVSYTAPAKSMVRSKTDEELREVFDGADLDGGGTLDKEEIAALSTKLGKRLTAKELDDAMIEMDEDKSDEVDFDEFSNWWKECVRKVELGNVVAVVQAVNKRDGSVFEHEDMDNLLAFLDQIAYIIKANVEDHNNALQQERNDYLSHFKSTTAVEQQKKMVAKMDPKKRFITAVNKVKMEQQFIKIGQTPPKVLSDIGGLPSIEELQQWSFPVLEYSLEQLVGCVVMVFHERGFFNSCKLTEDVVQKFATRIFKQYNEVPYHNMWHGFGVFQGCYWALTQCQEIRKGFTTQDQFALLVAAICHDTNHDGVNNPFHVAVCSDIAMVYNDTSVLESMHTRKCFETAREKGCEIFAGLEPGVYKQTRKTIIGCILQTDMTFHEGKMKKVEAMEQFSTETPEETQFWLETVLHSLDIGNVAWPWEQASRWARMVGTEFKLQVVREQEAGIPVSDYMKIPHNMYEEAVLPKLAGGQIGFANFIVKPCLEKMARKIPMFEDLAESLNHNLGKWKVITGADPEADADNPECVLPLPVGNELVCMNYARAKLGE